MIIKEVNLVTDIRNNTIYIDSLRKRKGDGQITVDDKKKVISAYLSDIPNNAKLTPYLTRGITIHDKEKKKEYYFKFTHKDMDDGGEDTYGYNFKSVDEINGEYWKVLLINT